MAWKRILPILTLFVFTSPILADSLQFRGPERDGHFPATGLRASWPEGGPPLLWSAEGLGETYASMAVVGDRIYTTGKLGTKGVAFALDRSGKQVWKTEYGAEHEGNGYPGSRTTPTYADGSLFLMSSMGEATALDAKTGKIQWQVNLLKKFGGENIYFGVSESPLVDGDRVIFTPGGKDASLVALDRKTGNTVWTTKGLSDGAAYCNPVLVELGGKRQIVTLVSKSLVGLDPETGSILWRQDYPVQYDIHAVSPLVSGRKIYVTHGYDQGGTLFELAADGKSMTQKWKEADLDVHHGGAVLADGKIYGAASNKTWFVLDFETGKQLASIRRLGKGAVVMADGLLYGYTEDGSVHLVNPDPARFEVISSFKITQGEGQHWSHPVIEDGVLYVRHGDVLMAYDVKAAS